MITYIKPTDRLSCGHHGVYWRRDDGTPSLGPGDGGKTVHCHRCGSKQEKTPDEGTQ